MSDWRKAGVWSDEYIRGSPWYPPTTQRYFTQLFNHNAGMQLGDPQQTDLFQRILAASPWFGFMPTSLFVPFVNGAMNHYGKKISEWKVCIDVSLFTPAELSLTIRDGFLEVKGKHEERPDQHGFTARCFTRKYRLPGDADVTRVTSTLSVDGILTVEAPLAEASAPAVIIPIKVEGIEASEKKPPKEQTHTGDVCVEATEESSREATVDQERLGSSSPELQSNEETKKLLSEKARETLSGDGHRPMAVPDESMKLLNDSIIQEKAVLKFQEIEVKPPKSEHKAPDKGNEMQGMEGSSAEELDGQQEAADSN